MRCLQSDEAESSGGGDIKAPTEPTFKDVPVGGDFEYPVIPFMDGDHIRRYHRVTLSLPVLL